jgi:hypothetical protein
VQGSKHEVAGLRRRERELDRLQIAHLANQDDVRVLAQSGPQRRGEGPRVSSHLALVDQAFLTGVYELDGVLHGQDVRLLGLVDVIDERRERGGFSAPGRARDHDQALLVRGKPKDGGRQPQLLDRQDLGRNQAKHRAHAQPAAEHVGAEPRGQCGDLVRKVDVVGLLELPLLLGAHHFKEQRLVLGVRQFLGKERDQVSRDPHERRIVGREVEVRSLLVAEHPKQLVNARHTDPRVRLDTVNVADDDESEEG